VVKIMPTFAKGEQGNSKTFWRDNFPRMYRTTWWAINTSMWTL
jgi:hypothetical protein